MRWNYACGGIGRLLVILILFSASPYARAEKTPPARLDLVPAADRARARTLMDIGDQRMGRGDARGALVAYRTADELVGVPTTGIEVGRAQAALGLWVEARDTWVKVALYPTSGDEPRPFTEARREAERLLVVYGARIPTLTIEIEPSIPPGMVLMLDEQQLSSDLIGVPLRVNPGVHAISAQASGFASAEAKVSLAERTERSIRLVLSRSAAPAARPEPREPDEPQPSRGSRTAMWAGFASALVGAAAGTATGIWAFEETNAAAELCMGTSCPPEASDELDRAKLASALSTGAFVLGGAGLGIGIWQAIVIATSSGPETRRAESAQAISRVAASEAKPRVALIPSASGAQLLLTARFP